MPKGQRIIMVSKPQDSSGKKPRGNGWGGKRANQGPPGNANALTHGTAALAVMLKRGLSLDHPVGRLLAERRNLYLADLGGPAACSNMEMGLCDRLAKLDLFECLLDARLTDPVTGRTRQMSWARLQSLGLLRVRLGDSYARMCGALGVKRREKLIDPFREEMLRQQREAADGDA